MRLLLPRMRQQHHQLEEDAAEAVTRVPAEVEAEGRIVVEAHRVVVELAHRLTGHVMLAQRRL